MSGALGSCGGASGQPPAPSSRQQLSRAAQTCRTGSASHLVGGGKACRDHHHKNNNKQKKLGTEYTRVWAGGLARYGANGLGLLQSSSFLAQLTLVGLDLLLACSGLDVVSPWSSDLVTGQGPGRYFWTGWSTCPSCSSYASASLAPPTQHTLTH